MTRGGSRRVPGSGKRRRKPRRCRYDNTIVRREASKFRCSECNRLLEYSETKTL
jgi:hypothetical protein